MKLKLIIGIVGILSACGFTNAPSLDTNQEKQDNNWVIGPFLRPEGVNPVISPQPTEFYCPMRKQQVKWEESDTFNPAATVKDGKIVVLYRAEDNSAQGIGKRTSRVGYAESKDGIEMKRLDNPVLFPAAGVPFAGNCSAGDRRYRRGADRNLGGSGHLLRRPKAEGQGRCVWCGGRVRCPLQRPLQPHGAAPYGDAGQKPTGPQAQ